MKTVLKIYECKNKRIEFGVYLTGREEVQVNRYVGRINSDFDFIRKDLCLIQLNTDSFFRGKFKEFQEKDIYISDGSIINMEVAAEQTYRKIIERRQYEIYEKFGI